MNDTNPQDELFDRNLRALSRELRLPADPTPEQTASWKQPLRAVPARRAAGRRWLGWAGGGAALAASLATALTLHLSAAHNKVRAETVFAELRHAMSNAFRISFENVGEDGLYVSGEVVVVCDPSAETLDGQEHSPAAIHMSARLRGDEADDEMAGLDALIELAMTSAHKWAYLRTASLPEAILKKHMAVAFIDGIARNGMLIQLDELLGDNSQLVTAVTPPQPPPSAAPDAPGDAPDRRMLMFGIQVGKSAGSEAQVDAQSEQVQQATVKSGFKFALSDDDEMGQVLSKVVQGEATREEFARLVTAIEESAGKVEIREAEPGLHVLTASDFKIDDAAEVLDSDAVLEVAYREGVGVPWATLKHVGLYDGHVRFEGVDLTADDARFSDERFLNDRVTRVMKPAALIPLLGALAIEAGINSSE